MGENLSQLKSTVAKQGSPPKIFFQNFDFENDFQFVLSNSLVAGILHADMTRLRRIGENAFPGRLSILIAPNLLFLGSSLLKSVLRNLSPYSPEEFSQKYWVAAPTKISQKTKFHQKASPKISKFFAKNIVEF